VAQGDAQPAGGGSTVEITRSRATRRAILKVPGRSPASTSSPATSASSATASACSAPSSASATAASTASTSLTSPDTNACLASESYQSQSGLPGRS
jgi:hypothetical protein